MSLQASVGFQIPTNVVEVGDEISTDQLAAIQAASTPSTGNPFATQAWVGSQGYQTASGLTQDQTYAISLVAIVNSFTFVGPNWSGTILAETPYFSANKSANFKFFMNNQYDFTPTWSGTSFSLPSMDDSSTVSTGGSGESFTIKWNGYNGGVPVI
jgi:hypothetical protein